MVVVVAGKVGQLDWRTFCISRSYRTCRAAALWPSPMSNNLMHTHMRARASHLRVRVFFFFSRQGADDAEDAATTHTHRQKCPDTRPVSTPCKCHRCNPGCSEDEGRGR